MVLVFLIVYIIGLVVDFASWGKEDSTKEYIKNFAHSLFWPIRWTIIVLMLLYFGIEYAAFNIFVEIRLWFKKRKNK